MVQNNIDRLCRRLGYQFTQPKLLKQALTHRSVSDENNERLEFLGDSILNCVISKALYSLFPHETEGQLSRLRAFLVKGERLAEIALEINLGDYLILGSGELRSGGFRRSSILADALEAIFAAVYLDGGLDPAQRIILDLYQTRLNDDILKNTLKDDKTQLQEWLQAKKLPLPTYQLDKITGEEHDQTFYVTCSVPQLQKSASGSGHSRRKAEQEAAKQLLLAILGSVY